MVLEIATAYGLAMTEVDGGWSRFAGGTVVIPNRTAERIGRKNPPFPEKRGISLYNCSSRYAERKLATGRAVLLDYRQA